MSRWQRFLVALLTGTCLGGGPVVSASSAEPAPKAEPATVALLPQVIAPEEIASVVFSPDGTRATTVARSNAHVWDVARGALLHVLSGPSGGLTTAAYSPDGERLVTAGNPAVVWDTRTGRALHRFDGVAGYVAYSSDGSTVLVAGSDGQVALYGRSGDLLRRFQAHPFRIEYAAFSTDSRLAVTCSGGSCAVWRTSTGELVRRLTQARQIQTVAFSADSRRVVTASDFAEVALWDLADPGRAPLLHRLASGVIGQRVALSPDGRSVAAIRSDARWGLWDADSGTPLCTFEGRFQEATFAPDGRSLFLAGSDMGTLVDVQRCATKHRIEGHLTKVAALSRDGTQLITTNSTANTILWDAVRGTVLRALTGQASAVLAAAFSPDGDRLVTANADATGVVWDLTENGTRLYRLAGHEKTVGTARFSPDGATLVTASGEGLTIVWDARDGTPIRRLPGYWAGFSPDGQQLVTTGTRDVEIWDAATGTSLRRLDVFSALRPEHQRLFDTPVRRATFSPDGRQLVVSASVLTTLWDPRTGLLVHRLGDGSYDAAFSPDGQRLYVSHGTTVGLWDPHSGDVLRRFEGDPSTWTLSLSADGRRVATGGRYHAAIWDAANAALLHDLKPSSQFGSALFSPDGTQVISGYGEDQAAIWDAESGVVLHLLDGHRGYVVSAAYTPDGKRVVTCSKDGTARIWNAETGAWLATLLSFDDGTWAVVDPEGRFDTADAGTLRAAVWRRSFDPDRALSLTTFARSYYTPGLLRRVWRAEPLDPVPDLLDANVATPSVALSVTAKQGGLVASVEVCSREETVPMRDGPRRLVSGAQNLQVFLNDRLVGSTPVLPAGCSTHQHQIPVPAGTASVQIAAHAFNSSDVKSDTVSAVVPNPRALETPQRRAFLVAIGADAYANEGFAPLAWAGADARAYVQGLQAIPGHDVRPVLLADGAGAAARPTRDNLRWVLRALAGVEPPPPWAPGLATAGPDDLVLVVFSGHGYAPTGGPFHLVLSDTERTAADGTGIAGAMKYAVSEEDLATWLAPIRAGEMALVVDACQSAASVEGEGFKPGPLGSKGFGQMAYDKGMLVLAATQSDAFAMESNELRHGILTYVLVERGLVGGEARTDADPGLSLLEWLRFAEVAVPRVARGQEPTARAMSCEAGQCRSLLRLTGAPLPVQQPRLFAFKGGGGRLIQAP